MESLKSSCEHFKEELKCIEWNMWIERVTTDAEEKDNHLLETTYPFVLFEIDKLRTR